MLQPTTLISLFLLAACSSDKTEESGDFESNNDVAQLTLAITLLDGWSNASLEGAELCIEEPVVEDNCYVTDANGVVEWVWSDPKESNFLGRFTMDQYLTTLYTGRYNDDVAELWQDDIDENGEVALSYFAFTETSVNLFLNTGGVAQQEGLGQILFFLGKIDGTGLEDAVITVTSDSGTEIGTVRYINSLLSALDTTLDSTSSSGGVSISNVEPGVHTITVTSSSYTCQAGFSWNSEIDNVVEIPVEADTLTNVQMLCTP